MRLWKTIWLFFGGGQSLWLWELQYFCNSEHCCSLSVIYDIMCILTYPFIHHRVDSFPAHKRSRLNIWINNLTKFCNSPSLMFWCRRFKVHHAANDQLFNQLYRVLSWNETFPTSFLPAALKTVLEVPLGSRFLRLSAKGPDVLGEWHHFSPNFVQKILFCCIFIGLCTLIFAHRKALLFSTIKSAEYVILCMWDFCTFWFTAFNTHTVYMNRKTVYEIFVQID